MILPTQLQQFNKQQREKRTNPMKRTIERITRAAILAVAFILCATSAWATAPTPTVVWDRNFADNSVVRGEDGHDYTFTLNDVNNTVSDGILKIGSTNKRGALISIGDTTATKVSVLVKYAFAKAPTASEVPVVIYSERGASANSPDVGFVSSGSSNTALWPFWCVTSSNYDYKQFSGVNLNRQSGYILLSYDCSTLKGYVGSSIASLSGFTQSFAWSGTLTHVGLGGPTGKAHDTSGSNADQYPAWNGLLIEKVALFVGEAYSNTDVEEYVFPGEATYYSQWDYANDIITWTTGSSGNKDMGGNATFALFDKSTGLDTATVYTGGNTDPAYGTSTQKFWYNLSYNSDGTSYKAPGLVLRVANNLATLTMGGTFGPLTLGGIIVEPGAYNNNLATYDMNQDPSNSNRSTILGDPTGKTETLFDFNESFAINRGGAFCFPGTVNLNIHTGKSLTLNQAAKVCASITGISNNGIIEDSMINAGGVLKMHGNGTLVPSAGLNASGASLDFSDLGSRVNETPFINGTLTLDGNTTFILPAGTVSPYKVATGISATAYPSFITIGGKKYAATVSAGANAGEIAWEINTATIDVAGDDYALSTIFTDPSSNKDYSLTVTADATLDVGTSEVRAIMIDVAEGKTLTLSGTSLTATTIYITGKGVVKVAAGGTLKGTVKGDGTVMYSGVLPTVGGSGVVFTDSAWEGTVWIYDYGSDNGTKVTSNLTADMPSWGNANSQVKFTKIRAYAPNSDITCDWTLVLEDEGNASSGYAWRCDDGYVANTLKIAELKGDGTFFDGGSLNATFTFSKATDFRGTFNIWNASYAGHKILIGDNASHSSAGSVAIGAGQTVTINKAWTVRNDLKVDGTVNVNAAITTGGAGILVYGTVNIKESVSAKFSSISGILNVDTNKTLSVNGNNDSLNYGGSGTVNVYGTLDMGTTRWTIGSSNVINLYEGGTISGAGQSTNGALDWYKPGTLNVYGTSTISANIRCRDDGNLSFNVVSGTCTFSGELYGGQPIRKTGEGKLKIAYTGSNASYPNNLPSVEAGTIELATGAYSFGSNHDLSGYTMTYGGTAVVKVVQTLDEYANGSNIVVSNIDSSIDSIKVVLATGTEETLTVSDSSATYSGSGTITVGGKACTFDWEFNGDLTSVGYNTTSLSGSSVFDEGNQKLYVRSAPYYDSGSYGTWTWADNWTVAIKATMPARGKDIVIAFGTKTGGVVALVTSPNDGKVKLVRTTKDEAATDISEMTVADRSGAEHLYIFSKTSDGRMQVYCDDTLIDDKEVTGIASLPGTLQVGSIHGGRGDSGLTTPESTDNASIDFLRVYNYEISESMRNKIIADYAWVNPNRYTRTVSGDENLSSADAWTKPSDSSTVAIPVTDADAIVTTSSSSAALTVNTNLEADTLTINSGAESAALRLKAGTGTLVAAKVVINVPVIVEYGAVDFSGSVVTFGEGGSLTYDFSGVAINSRTTRLVAKLTGLISAPADLADSSAWPVQVTAHSDASSLADCYESTFSYDTTDSAYYYICGPDHDWGSDVYYAGGYWSSNSGNTISVTNAAGVATKVFTGDTVVIPAYYPGDTPAIYSDSSLPANVSKIRLSKSKIKMCSGVDSGDIFTGVTWTIDSGCTLWFGVGGNHPNSLGAMTINGPGTVECGDITINGKMSGDAPVTIRDNVTTCLTTTGSIATAHTISGSASAKIAVAKTTPISDRMTFGTWTGTVSLPENFDASEGVDLHYYGKAGSTVEINGFSGWLKTGATYSGATTYGRQVNPHLKLNGDMSITGLSAAWYDLLGGISGTGNFVLASTIANKPNGESFWITKVSAYTGSIVNNTTGSAETTIVIKELETSSFVGGTKLLSRGGTGPLSISKVTIGETEQSLSDLCYESDGVYVAAAEYNSVKYPSVAAAIEEATDAHLEDITLLNGCTTVPDGYLISGGNVVKAQAAIIDTEGTAHYFATPTAAAAAVDSYLGAPSPETYDYFAVYFGTDVEMQVNLGAMAWNVFSVKVKCLNGATVSVVPNSVEYEFSAGDPDENSIVTYTKTEKATTYVWAGTGEITQNWGNYNRWKVETSEGATATRAPSTLDTVVFNGGAPISISGVTVAAVQVGGLATISGSGTLTATSGIVLTDSAATLTVSGVTLSPAPTTNVSRSRVVHVTEDGTTTYSVELIPGTIFSVY